MQTQAIPVLRQNTAALLSRFIPLCKHIDRADNLRRWSVLLASDVPNSIRPSLITVYGIGALSGAQDLVTALIHDPLASDQSRNTQILERWKDRDERRPWLSTRTNIPSLGFSDHSLEILEFRPPPSCPSYDANPSIGPADQEALASADVPVIVCSPLSISVSSLLQSYFFRSNTHAVLVLTALPPPELTESFISLIQSLDHNRGPKVLFVDPSRAVAANLSLVASPPTPTTVQKYQDEYLGSRMSTILETIRARFTSPSLHDRTALAMADRALWLSRSVFEETKSDLFKLSCAVDQLKDELKECMVKTPKVVFGIPAARPGSDKDIIALALQQASKDIQASLQSLTWWKTLWSLDEITATVNQAVYRAWCHDLEKQLILQAGCLVALQREMANAVIDLQAKHDHPLFRSPVLVNSLQQLAASPSFKITPQTLTYPLDKRRAQITEHLTTELHLGGQRAALGMGVSVATGAGIGWTGWLGWLTGSGEGVLGLVGLDTGTAVGMGLLIALGGVRWAAGKWERAKRRWLEDWNRVGDGLDRDLRMTLDQTMKEKVLSLPTHGCDRLSKIVSERRMEIDELQREIDNLTRTLKELTQTIET